MRGALPGASNGRLPDRCLAAVLVRTGDRLAWRVRAVVGMEAAHGLLGRDGMEPGEGLWLACAPFGAIHSIGMRFRFDAVYLGRRGRVRRVLRSVPPGRLCPLDWATFSVLELPEGAASQVAAGDTIMVG